MSLDGGDETSSAVHLGAALKEALKGFANEQRAENDLCQALTEYRLFCSMGRCPVVNCPEEGDWAVFTSEPSFAALTGPISLHPLEGNESSCEVILKVGRRYPDEPPTLMIRMPAESSSSGRKYEDPIVVTDLPYLSNWSPRTSRLDRLLRALCDRLEGRDEGSLRRHVGEVVELRATVDWLTLRLNGSAACYNEAKRQLETLREEGDMLRTQLERSSVEKERLAQLLSFELKEKEKLEKEVENERAAKRSAEADKRKLKLELKAENEKMQKTLQDEYIDSIRIQPDEVEILETKLGSGSFADVYMGLWKGAYVAVKKFHDALQGQQYYEKLFLQEIALSARFRHPNIVQVCGVTTIEKNPIQIIMEMLEASMVDVLEFESGQSLVFREQIDLSENICSGISYLHQQKYIHCDIRSSNILITRGMVAKVGDLGAAHAIGSSTSAGPLSPHYIAPERPTFGRSTISSDVYSLGVTLIEVFCGKAANKSERYMQIRMIKDDDLQDVCMQAVAEQPEERLTAVQLLERVCQQKVKEKYVSCPLKRVVIGKVGSESVRLIELK